MCFPALKRQDVFYAVFHTAKIDAACAVVMARGKGYKSLKQFVQFHAGFKKCVCIYVGDKADELQGKRKILQVKILFWLPWA